MLPDWMSSQIRQVLSAEGSEDQRERWCMICLDESLRGRSSGGFCLRIFMVFNQSDRVNTSQSQYSINFQYRGFHARHPNWVLTCKCYTCRLHRSKQVPAPFRSTTINFEIAPWTIQAIQTCRKPVSSCLVLFS